ncbi:MAG TPA: DUF3048 domain-containing protein [Bacillota bacterium]|nr:DUF3048 domain-containing protein [Bacillota bacterium]
MIDGFRRRPTSKFVHPAAQHVATHAVIGGNAQPAPAFKPPEVIAAEENSPANAAPPEPHKKRSFKAWLAARTKKQWIIFAVVAVLVLAGGGVGLFKVLHHKKPVAVSHAVTKKVVTPPKPTTVANDLTGRQVDPSINLRPVTAVMIENSEDARPQSGLDQAGVVFEAVAEGGITRFVALFQDTAPAYIGPVRSVRPYYEQWLLGFDAPVAHVGGSAEALANMGPWGIKDLDQFYNSATYHRISSRYAPHNVYTSMDELNALETKKGYTSSKFTPLARKAEAPFKTPVASSIDLTISSAFFNVHYDYDSTTNSYKRSEGGAAHMELNQDGSQVQITPKVVVALVLQQGIAADDLHTSYTATGSGAVYIFQDGNVITGSWHKASNNENFTFTDASGAAIKLNPGQTWFTAVNATSHVAYK